MPFDDGRCTRPLVYREGGRVRQRRMQTLRAAREGRRGGEAGTQTASSRNRDWTSASVSHSPRTRAASPVTHTRPLLARTRSTLARRRLAVTRKRAHLSPHTYTLRAPTHASPYTCEPQHMRAPTHASPNTCEPQHMRAPTHASPYTCEPLHMHMRAMRAHTHTHTHTHSVTHALRLSSSDQRSRSHTLASC